MISGLFVMILALGFDLSQIAAIGSIAILFVHGVTHLGHLRRIDETGALPRWSRRRRSPASVPSGIALLYLSREAPSVIALLGLLGASALALELALQRLRGREVRGRVPR
ncbi:MAG: hypothetical protein R3E53_12080 [Myxococcota bacterium]